MMKKIVFMVCLLTTFINTCVFADGFKLELNTETIVVEANVAYAGRYVNIVVLNPTFQIGDIAKNGAVQFEDSVKSDENGNVKFNIKINTELMKKDDKGEVIPGDLTAFVSGDGINAEYTTFFAPLSVRKASINKIKSDGADVAKELEENKKILGLENAVFNGVSKKVLEVFVKNELADLNIDNIQKKVFGYSILAAFNENKTSLVFDGKKFIYPDEMGLTKYDEENSCTIYKNFINTVADDKKIKVVNALCNKGYTDFGALLKDFAKETVLKAIEYPSINGYDYAEDVLTAENAKLVGLNLAGYFNNKTTVNRGIVKYHADTIQKLQEKIDSFISDAGGSSSSGGNSSKNTGMTTRVSGGMPVITSAVNDNVTHTSDAGNEKNKFNDINDVAWAKADIEYLVEKGIINGVGDGRFEPSRTIKREEFAKIISIAFNYTQEDNSPLFSDTVVGGWYNQYVNSLFKMKIINGVSDGKFGIGENLTRQDMAVILYRISKGSIGVYEKTTEFGDDGDISDYAREAVACMAEAGIINGFEDGSFRPMQPCTRAQTCTVVAKLLKK